MKYNQNFRKKKSLVFLRNLKLPYFLVRESQNEKQRPFFRRMVCCFSFASLKIFHHVSKRETTAIKACIPRNLGSTKKVK